MKIYTEIEFKMTEDGLEEVRSSSFEYDGPVAEAKGGGGGPPPPDLSGTLDKNTRRLNLTDPNSNAKSKYSYDFATGDVYLNNNLKYARTDPKYEKIVQPYVDNFLSRKKQNNDIN